VGVWLSGDFKGLKWGLNGVLGELDVHKEWGFGGHI
jgi:hypothetical protein